MRKLDELLDLLERVVDSRACIEYHVAEAGKRCYETGRLQALRDAVELVRKRGTEDGGSGGAWLHRRDLIAALEALR